MSCTQDYALEGEAFLVAAPSVNVRDAMGVGVVRAYVVLVVGFAAVKDDDNFQADLLPPPQVMEVGDDTFDDEVAYVVIAVGEPNVVEDDDGADASLKEVA